MALGRDLDDLLGVQIIDQSVVVWVASAEAGKTLERRAEESDEIQEQLGNLNLIFRREDS